MTQIENLKGVVASSILRRTVDLSRALRALGVPHALIGGLAVGLYGYPRGTKDVDFLVGNEAFSSTSPFLVYRDELKDLVAIGETDLMSVPDKYPVLADELRLEAQLPVISLRGLVLMKLDANRARDREDVRMILARSRSKLHSLRKYLQEHAPTLVHRLAEVLSDDGHNL